MRNILQTARKNNPPTAQNSLRLPILLRFLVYSSSSSYYSFIICLTHGCICIACVSPSSSLYIFVVIERDERGPGLLFPYFLSSFSSSSSPYSFYILFSFHPPPPFYFLVFIQGFFSLMKSIVLAGNYHDNYHVAQHKSNARRREPTNHDYTITFSSNAL